MVNRVWRTNALKPHLCRTFKVSNDRQLHERLVDVGGLYLNPPEHALVICVDEKSQAPALDRTQPGLPLRKGRLIGTCMPRHRHQEWIKFLKLTDEQTPSDRELHLTVDDYSTHKHPKVQGWVTRTTTGTPLLSNVDYFLGRRAAAMGRKRRRWTSGRGQRCGARRRRILGGQKAVGVRVCGTSAEKPGFRSSSINGLGFGDARRPVLNGRSTRRS